MEKLYEFSLSSYHTSLYKDYCEVDEQDLLGSHQSDSPQVFGFFSPSVFRKEFHYDKTLLDEQSYVENYTNLCSHPMFKRASLYVEKNEDKVSIKFFIYSKNRPAGKKFFKKETICHFITYNFKQNCLYSGSIRNYHLKRKSKKQLSKNLWVNKPIQTFIQLWVNHIRGMRLNDFERIEQSGREVNDAIGLFLSNIPNTDTNIHGYDNVIYKRYLDGIGIKAPNNWMYFNRTFPQITKKIFKKYDYKFVDAFMGFNGLYGDKVKKVLHTIQSTDGVNTLKFSILFFGKDLILSQPDSFIKKLLESNIFFGDWEEFINQNRYTLDRYGKNEIKNCFEIFKLVISGNITLHTFTDHIRIKGRLNSFEPVTWKSNNYERFTEEHYEWSEKIGTFKSAIYNRFYYEPFKKFIETPIFDFFPILLSDHREYIKESIEQSNCVRTYVDNPSSIIISVRKGDNENKERATIEYKIRKYDENIILKRVQSLGRFNHKLDESWEKILKILDDRINKSLESNLFELPKVEIKRGTVSCMSNIIFLGGAEPFNDKKISQILVFEKDIFKNKNDNLIDFIA